MDKNTFLDFIKSFWLVVGTVVVSVLLMLVFWFMIVQARTDFLQKNEEYNVLAAKRAGTLQVNRDREGLEVLGKRLNDAFVFKDKFVEFIEFVESTAKSAGNDISLSNISEGNGLQSIKVNLEGSYSGLINFIAQLENSPYLVRLTNISVNKSFNSASQSETVRTSLDIQTQLP